MERIPTGIEALDQLLQGGFPEGASILVVGRPGSGKTVMAHQIMFQNASPSFRALYLTTLAEPQVKVLRFQQGFSYFDQEKLQRSVIYHDLGSVLRRGGPACALQTVTQLLQQHEPRLVVVDTIRAVAEMFTSPMQYRAFLLDLSLQLATWNATTIFLGEYAESEIELRSESAIADGIICLSGTEEKKHQKRCLRILKMRGTAFSGGENCFQITRDGIDLFPRPQPGLIWPTSDRQEDRVPTGIDALDGMSAGGLPRGSTTLISGPSGSGKTVLALHFAMAAIRRGEPAIYVTFEETPEQVLRGARSLGLDLEPAAYSGQFQLIHSPITDMDPDAYLHQVRRLVRELGAARVIIDSVTAFLAGLGDHARWSEYIWILTDYLKGAGVLTLLTQELQDGVLSVGSSGHPISFVADNIIGLRLLEEQAVMRRALRVLKIRGSDHDDTMRELLIRRDGVTLGRPLQSPVTRLIG